MRSRTLAWRAGLVDSPRRMCRDGRPDRGSSVVDYPATAARAGARQPRRWRAAGPPSGPGRRRSRRRSRRRTRRRRPRRSARSSPARRRRRSGARLDAVPVEHRAGPADLGQAEVEELLATEAGLDGHDQQHVQLGQQVLVGLDRRGRLQRHRRAGAVRRGSRGPAGPAPSPPRRGRSRSRSRPRRTPAALRSASSIIRCASSGTSVALRERLDHRRPEGQVRDEVVVHHVDVDPVRARDPGHLVPEVGEVGIQDARRDLDSHER